MVSVEKSNCLLVSNSYLPTYNYIIVLNVTEVVVSMLLYKLISSNLCSNVKRFPWQILQRNSKPSFGFSLAIPGRRIHKVDSKSYALFNYGIDYFLIHCRIQISCNFRQTLRITYVCLGYHGQAQLSLNSVMLLKTLAPYYSD